MKLLFLDVDGVLNRHDADRHDNGYCGINKDCAAQLNRILKECPDVQIVVSSAWRYCVHNGWSNLEGFEHLLMTHGIACKGRIHGFTDPDPEAFRTEDHAAPFDAEYWRARGLQWRARQIFDYFFAYFPGEPSVVLDDLPLNLANLVKTEPEIGLTSEIADEVIRRFA